MTGWGVERESRPAYRPSVVSPAGGPALMPPPSQGAERQRRRSGRTRSPWGLRVLVVGGIAGAAWLLSGAAAQADDRDPATGLLGAVVHDITAAQHSTGIGKPLAGVGKPLAGTAKPLAGTAKPETGTGTAKPETGTGTGKHTTGTQNGAGDQGKDLVHRILTTAVQPLASGERHDLGAVTTIPKRLVGTVGEVAGGAGDAGSPLGGVDRVVRDLTAPVRLTGEAVDTGRTAPAVEVPRQDRPQPGPGTTAPEVSEPAAADIDGTPVPHGGPVADVPPVQEPEAEVSPAGKPAAIMPLGGKFMAAATLAENKPARDTAREAPDGEGPVQVHLGAANGVPASGPGTATDGGPSAAVLPSAIADSTVACHRLPIATEVEVRRHDAEAPTVSPD
ncbi:hypothetical protein [Actinoplanes sp. NPDC049316]|uniref:hypothetical protein n=1 Tax=Actinoplanes sp. NPDC049316 TaxID=3154727 RepID=UPI003417A7C5